MNRLSSVIFGVVLLSTFIQSSDAAFAQGSLQLVFHPQSGKSSAQHPITANLTHLWCQAAETQENGIAERVPITKAHFLHFGTENPDKSYIGNITDNKAYLDLGTKDLFTAGKYRCEVTTENEEFVYGNMFIYMRPVFHTNGSLKLYVLDEKKNFELTGSSVKATRGTTAVIQCQPLVIRRRKFIGSRICTHYKRQRSSTLSEMNCIFEMLQTKTKEFIVVSPQMSFRLPLISRKFGMKPFWTNH